MLLSVPSNLVPNNPSNFFPDTRLPCCCRSSDSSVKPLKITPKTSQNLCSSTSNFIPDIFFSDSTITALQLLNFQVRVSRKSCSFSLQLLPLQFMLVEWQSARGYPEIHTVCPCSCPCCTLFPLLTFSS